jgi:murein L,D-transpeptidase YcbB/YkuD
MSGRRYDRILSSTALALILVAPLGARAQDSTANASKQNSKIAATFSERYSSEQTPAPASPATTTPAASGQPASTVNAPVATDQPARPSDPLALLDPDDRPIAESIRDLLAAKGEKFFVNKNEREAVETFYQSRNLAPLWLDKGIENARAAAVIARLRNSDADGLDPADYRTPAFAGPAPDALAEAELTLTQAVLTYARHVQAGRFPYRLVRDSNIGLPQAAPDPARVLASVAEAADAGKALDEFSPQNEPYQKLKAALAQLRGRTAGARDEITAGPVLALNRKHPVEDARVPSLRERFRLPGDASDLHYDARLADAVKQFQRANALPATGSLDARTVRELNHPAHDRRIDTVIANMERWRWYPRDLGTAHVEVNEPDFTLKVLNEGRQVWGSRIVIGKPSLPTPLLSEKMNSITINPTWHVPPSIVHNEYLPAQAKDPGVLSRMGLRVSYKDGEVQITMPPGGENPLGHIRFNFFNRFMVYQHDTPDQYMFGHDVRAESHGCMRVQDAPKYAEVLSRIARPDEQWTAEKFRSVYGSVEQEIPLESVPIWIHLTYQTAFVDDAGRLQIRGDLYNLDNRTLAAIKSEHGIVEPPSERKRESEVALETPPKPARAHARSAARHRLAPSSYQSTVYGASGFSGLLPPRSIYYR